MTFTSRHARNACFVICLQVVILTRINSTDNKFPLINYLPGMDRSSTLPLEDDKVPNAPWRRSAEGFSSENNETVGTNERLRSTFLIASTSHTRLINPG